MPSAPFVVPRGSCPWHYPEAYDPMVLVHAKALLP